MKMYCKDCKFAWFDGVNSIRCIKGEIQQDETEIEQHRLSQRDKFRDLNLHPSCIMRNGNHKCKDYEKL